MTEGYGRRWRSIAGPYTTFRLAGQATEFVGFLVLARRLEPSLFGELAIAFLVCRYAGIIADWGAMTRGSRDVAADGLHGSIHSFVRHRTLVTVGMTALVALGMVVTGYAALVPTVLVIVALGLSRDWIALGRERGARAALPSLVQGVVLLAVSLTVSTLLGGALAVAAGYGAAAVISVAANRVPADQEGQSSGAPAMWILFAYIGTQITSSIDVILLGAMRSSADAGIYAAIYRLPNAWLALLTALIGGAMPIVTRAIVTDATASHRLQARALRTSAVFGALVLLAAPVVYVLVPVIFGADYTAGQAPAAILMVATAVVTFCVPLHVFAVANAHDRRYSYICLGGAAINIAVNLAVIPAWGMVGAAIATLLAQLAVTALLWNVVRHPPSAVPVVQDR